MRHPARSAEPAQALVKKKTVKFSLDPSNLPPLSATQQDELTALAKMPDDQIDTNDIAPLGEAFWKGALHNPFYKPTKQVTTVRIDADVLLWLKSTGKGYQTRINAILRDAMMQKHGVR
jgi:uncharacterized protein (DUF4415 family)